MGTRDDDARAILDAYRRDYERDRNPVYAWRGYRYARRLGLDLPEWLLAYLDGCAKAVQVLDEAADAPSVTPPSYEHLLNDFGFRSGLGKPHAFSAIATRADHEVFIFAMLNVKRAGVAKKGEAAEQLAEMLGMSLSKAQGLVTRFWDAFN